MKNKPEKWSSVDAAYTSTPYARWNPEQQDFGYYHDEGEAKQDPHATGPVFTIDRNNGEWEETKTSTKIQIIHDTDPSTPENISAYVHCAKCIDEIPPGVSPRDWSRLQIGYTSKGFQVVCVRHNCNVDNMVIKLP